jgi:hypothetical protein
MAAMAEYVNSSSIFFNIKPGEGQSMLTYAGIMNCLLSKKAKLAIVSTDNAVLSQHMLCQLQNNFAAFPNIIILQVDANNLRTVIADIVALQGKQVVLVGPHAMISHALFDALTHVGATEMHNVLQETVQFIDEVDAVPYQSKHISAIPYDDGNYDLEVHIKHCSMLSHSHSSQ